MNRRNLLPALADERVKQATIDEKVRRILQTAVRFGWIDRPQGRSFAFDLQSADTPLSTTVSLLKAISISTQE
jgi:hypothetical protein